MFVNLASFAVSCASASAADLVAGEVPLTDVLAVVVVQRQVLAIDARGGGQTSEKLRLNEEVLWTGSRGVIGVALTDQRILAATTESGSWSEIKLHRTESAPEDALLGERVALMVTDERIIGLNGGSGNLVEARLGLRESILVRRIGENVGAVVSNRRALGLSPFAGGFSEIALGLKERVESVNTNSNLATIVTDRRILIYRSPSGSWEERRLNLK